MYRSRKSIADTGSALKPAIGLLSFLARLPNPKPWLAYVAAILATALAAAIRWWLGLLVGASLPPYITFYPVAMLATLLGGTGPGLVATALSALTLAFTFLAPTGNFAVANPAEQLGLAIFCGINIAITFICAALRAARHRTFAEARRAQASEVRYRRLFEAAHDGVLMLDTRSHKITDANPFITQLLGYSRDELLGKELWQIGLLKDAQASRAAFDQLATQGYIRYDDLPLQAKTGETREVEFVSNVYDEDGRSVVQCNIRDITRRKQAEAERTALREQLAADLAAMNRLHGLSTRFLQQQDLHALLDALLETAIVGVDAQLAHVHLLDPATGELPIAAQRGLDESFLDYFSHIKPGQIACGSALQTSQCVVVEDVTKSPLFLADPAAMQLKLASRIRAMICTPLVTHVGQAVGVLSIDFHEPHHPSERDLRFLDLLARMAADFIERKQAEHALRASEQFNRSLIESSLDCIKTLDLEGKLLSMSVGGQQLLEIGDIQSHLNTSWTDFWKAEDRPRVRQAVAAARNGGTGRFQAFCPSAAGTPKWWDVLITPIRDAQGRISRLLSVSRDITEHKAVEQALYLSERRYRSFVEATNHVLWRTNAKGEADQPMPSWNAFTGQTEQQSAGFGWMDAIHPDDRPRALQTWNAATAARTLYQAEYRLRNRSGEWRQVLARGVPLLAEDGTVREYQGACIDITDQRRAEEALRRTEALYHTMARNIPEGAMSLVDRELRYLTAEGQLLPRLGLSKETMEGRTVEEVFPGDTGRIRTEHFRQALAGETTSWETEYQGRTIWTQFVPLPDERGEVSAAMSLALDTTDRKRQEKALLEQAHLTQLRADAVQILQERAPVPLLLQRVAALLVERFDAAFARVWTLDAAGQTLELQASAGMYTHLDGPHSRIPVGQFKIGRIAQERRPLSTNQVLGDSNIPAQDWARREGLVAFAGFPLLLEDRLLGVVALFARHPLSTAAIETFSAVASSLAQGLGRLLAEQALRSSEARLFQAVRVARLGTFDHDLLSGKIDYSPQLREILGLAADESLSLPALLERIPSEHRQRTAEAIRCGHDPAGDGLIELEHPVAVPSRGTRWLSVRAQTSFDGPGPGRHAVRTIGVVLDITEQKEFTVSLESTVQQRTAKLQEAFAELEHMSYSMVHDMRAPLRAMQTFSTLAEEECAACGHGQTHDYFRRIRNAATRLDRLVTDALNYNKVVREQPSATPVDLGRLLRGMLESYPNLQPSEADIQLDFQQLLVLGNESLLTQVFGNLLDNAVKFVAPGVRPRIRLWAEEMQSAECGVRPELATTEHALGTTQRDSALGTPYSAFIRVWLEDNGLGIPKDAQEKIFLMFRRMHRENEYPGTGIGLAIVKKAIERMGGQVGLESEPGHGSKFWVQLPKVVPAQSQQPMQHAA
jgi:PAS domain S-box-containing protein